jgi:hypothetical protein
MRMTEMKRVPLAEAWRIATGKEPPVLTPEQKAEFDERRRLVRERAREIYAGLQPGEVA